MELIRIPFNNNCVTFLNIESFSDKITLMATVSTVSIEVNMLANLHHVIKIPKSQQRTIK